MIYPILFGNSRNICSPQTYASSLRDTYIQDIQYAQLFSFISASYLWISKHYKIPRKYYEIHAKNPRKYYEIHTKNWQNPI